MSEEQEDPDPERVVGEELTGAWADLPEQRSAPPEGDLPDVPPPAPHEGLWSRIVRAVRGR